MYTSCSGQTQWFLCYTCYNYFETSAMKTLTSTLEGKADQPVPRWLEPKVCNYFFKSTFELLRCVTFIVVALVNVFDFHLESCSNRRLWVLILCNALDLVHSEWRFEEWMEYGIYSCLLYQLVIVTFVSKCNSMLCVRHYTTILNFAVVFWWNTVWQSIHGNTLQQMGNIFSPD